MVVKLPANGCAQVNGRDPPAPDVTVYAAASLQNALTEIGRKYEEANPKTKVLFWVRFLRSIGQENRSGRARRRLHLGLGEVDAVPGEATKGSLRPEQGPASEWLICVVPFDSELKLNGPEDLANVSRIAIGDPAQAPAGEYAMEALKKLGSGRNWTTESGWFSDPTCALPSPGSNRKRYRPGLYTRAMPRHQPR